MSAAAHRAGRAAAETGEDRADRHQLGDDVSMAVLDVGEYGPAGGQADFCGHADVGRRRSSRNVRRQPIDDCSGLAGAAGAGQRHHRVQVVEHVPRFVQGAGCPCIGERREATAHVDSVEVQRQQGAGVEHLDGYAGGLFVVDASVVDGERVARVTGLEQVQRQMPPVVDGEQVAIAPVGLAGAQEADAFVDPACIS